MAHNAEWDKRLGNNERGGALKKSERLGEDGGREWGVY